MPDLFDGSEDLGVAPATDQLEVTLIGPGYGEAILIHIGDGAWLAIDSCRTRRVPQPAPLAYLEALGVAPAQVRMIVASHWDDDHIRGLAEIVTRCDAADVVFSSALGRDEFFAYTATYAKPLTATARSGVREMHEVQRILAASGRRVRSANVNRRLYGPEDMLLAHGQPLEIWSLSPSDEEREMFLVWLASQMPQAGETRRVATQRKPNDLSTVILVSVGEESILLGGDLEEEGKATTGWTAILSAAGRPRRRSSLYKIAHHGSHNGDHPGIWDELLEPGAHAILAPFKRGKESLPRESDIARIESKTRNAFATTTLTSRSPRRRNPTVDKTIRESTISFAAIPQEPGMLRLRKTLRTGTVWSVECFGDAVPLAHVTR